MGTPLLPQGNDIKRNVLCILLCAGEGTRIRSYMSDIPKPLISISNSQYKPILLDTITKLKKFKIETILIITGHLKEKIEEFTNELITSAPDLASKIKLLDSGREYQKGTLYSFLSITSFNQYFNEDLIFFIIPGDTVFDDELLGELLNHKYQLESNNKSDCILFYRKIRVSSLWELYNNSTNDSKVLISIAKPKKYKANALKQIIQIDISKRSKEQILCQIIPCFITNYRFIKNIQKGSKKSKINTLMEAINLLLKRNNKIKLFEIRSELKFYDIDTFHVLSYLKKGKKVDNSSSENLRVDDSKK
ncbi:MAG: sugar phosphate nucleotidyltransferase [Candidatus Hermodarchaeota archaeon]